MYVSCKIPVASRYHIFRGAQVQFHRDANFLRLARNMPHRGEAAPRRSGADKAGGCAPRGAGSAFAPLRPAQVPRDDPRAEMTKHELASRSPPRGCSLRIRARRSAGDAHTHLPAPSPASADSSAGAAAPPRGFRRRGRSPAPPRSAPPRSRAPRGAAASRRRGGPGAAVSRRLTQVSSSRG